ncbi:hypothetical protein [Streptomyces lydicus]|uniref:hypothetical protein n=1 Tax=Streptomyces lydicus TaxID=47763 RepID=UPI003796279B
MKLSDFPALQSTTIRGDLSRFGTEVREGLGTEGDVVLVRVVDPGGVVFLVDSQEARHPVRAGTVLLGVLANRDSTTHASGGLPADGIPIAEGTQLSWLGGQSGLFGIESWSPATGNAHGAQASATLEAIGLLTGPTGAVNTAQLARTPAVEQATAPVLVICGTAAEVGKTTLAGRMIDHLVNLMGLHVVAIKPTGSGGIADSLAHRKAGASATVDLVDCGLPSSYTSAERFAAQIGHCLLYAEEHRPDLVVCELGGDLIWGNNDTFLRQPELRPKIAGMVCVSGDATGALGARAFLESAGLGDLPVTYAPAHTRNPVTFRARLAHLAPQLAVLDTADTDLIPYLHRVVYAAGSARLSAQETTRP